MFIIIFSTFDSSSSSLWGPLESLISNRSSFSKDFTSAGGAQRQRGYGSPSPGQQIPEQVPSAPPAPQQHLPPITEERESTAEEGASGEGASSQDGGRITDLDSESDLDMTGMGPVLPAMRKCGLRIGEEVGDGELEKQVAQYIADSGATCHMPPDADGFTNYRECSRP